MDERAMVKRLKRVHDMRIHALFSVRNLADDHGPHSVYHVTCHSQNGIVVGATMAENRFMIETVLVGKTCLHTVISLFVKINKYIYI